MSTSAKVKHIAWEAGKAFGVAALLVVLMLWLAGACTEKVPPGPPVSQPAGPTPRTVRVESKSFPLLVAQTGTLQTRTQAQVSSRVTAQIREIPIHEGMSVTGPGAESDPATVLARLDDREIKAHIQQGEAEVGAMKQGLASAKAQLEAARANLQAAQAREKQVLADWHRYEDLYKKQAATGQQIDHARAQKQEAEAQTQAARQQVSAAEGDVDKIQAQIKQSEAALEEARVMLTYTSIEAPFDGTVARKLVDIGDMVTPGQALFLLDTPAEPELHARVAESLVGHLQRGTPLDVHIDALGVSLEGSVRDIVRQADAQTRTVTVKVSLPAQAGLLSGMSGHINVAVGEYEAVVVPQRAVHEVGQLHLVNVLNAAGRVERRYVRLGPEHGEDVEVLAGLRAGEEVAVP